MQRSYWRRSEDNEMSKGQETVGGKELSGEELATLLGVKTASDWMRTAADKPVPKMLFGEFWLEGELGVMFADTGKGKSILGPYRWPRRSPAARASSR